MLKSLWENITRRTIKSTSDILKESVLFQDLTQKELKFVTNIVHIRDYRAKEIIFRQSDAGYGMYIIADGSVNITVEDTYAEDQTEEPEIFITRLTTGDFFGELALVEENGKRSATATADENTQLIGFFKPNLFEMLERSPATGVKITLRLSEVLGKRLIETTEKISVLNDQINRLKNGTNK